MEGNASQIEAFLDTLSHSPFLLSDGGIETYLAFEMGVALDPVLGVAGLLEDERGRAILERLYERYLDVGRRHEIPMQIGTPTFRAGFGWLRRAGLGSPSGLIRINGEGARLLARLRKRLGGYRAKVHIGGVVGPMGDAYRPEEAPDGITAQEHHQTQVHALAGAGVDFLYAPTFPAAPEVLGVARAMSGSSLPYVLSPIINAEGTLLDGTPLAELITRIDQFVTPPPAGYTVSCVHPSVLHAALSTDHRLRHLAGVRPLGIKANGSMKTPEERVALHSLDADSPEHLADQVLTLRAQYKLKVLGGCCGTDHRYIEALARRLVEERAG